MERYGTYRRQNVLKRERERKKGKGEGERMSEEEGERMSEEEGERRKGKRRMIGRRRSMHGRKGGNGLLTYLEESEF